MVSPDLFKGIVQLKRETEKETENSVILAPKKDLKKHNKDIMKAIHMINHVLGLMKPCGRFV